MRGSRGVISLVVIGVASASLACGDSEQSTQLRNHPVLGAYQLDEDLRLDLVAQEPVVMDPVDLEFDAQGDAYVLEMPGYPVADDGERPGRIVRLADTDSDGDYDERTVFADDFRYADSLAPAYDGFLVADPPDLVYVRDTTGDGVADLRQTLLTGFAVGPSESNFNGLRFGPDGWYHGANGSSGGLVRPVGALESEAVSIRGLDFRFRVAPKTTPDAVEGELELARFETTDRMGGGFGLDWDRWGRRFVTHEQKHIQAVVMPRRYFDSRYDWPPETVEISDYGRGGQTMIFPVSRTVQRPNHPDQAGMFTSACGLTHYDGEALPERFRGAFLVAAPVHNLVHVAIVEEEAGGFVARRDREGLELLAATDPAFRPVNFSVGPAGGLYVVDMYREVIEHPEWIPDEMEAEVDVLAGANRGRLYRVATASNPWPRDTVASLAELSDGELIESLGSINVWRRWTALRLLGERGVGPEEPEWLDTAKEATRSADPGVRLAALWALGAVDHLEREIVLERIEDSDPGVLETTLWLGEELLQDEALATRYLTLAKETSGRIRNQALLSLSTMPGAIDGDSLGELALLVSGEEWSRRAWLASAVDSPVESLEQILGLDAPAATLASLSEGLTAVIAQRAEPNEVARVLELLANRAAAAVELGVLERLAGDLDAAQLSLPSMESELGGSLRSSLGELLEHADPPQEAALWSLAKSFQLDLGEPQRLAEQRALGLLDEVLDASERAHRLRLLEHFSPPEHRDLLIDVLRRGLPVTLQMAAIEQLGRMRSAEVGERLVSVFSSLPPEPRRAAGDVLLYRKENHDALVTALEEGTLSLGELNLHLERRRTLIWWAEPEIRERASKLFTDLGVFTRKAVIDQFSGALDMPGDARDGRVLFAQLCARCHVHGRYGRDIGPDLTDIGRRSRASLLHDILDPNARVSPEYLIYDVETTSGELVSGLLTEDGGDTLVLTSADGGTRRVPRSDVVEVHSSGLSLMPEELELGLSTEDFAGLLAFLEQGA